MLLFPGFLQYLINITQQKTPKKINYKTHKKIVCEVNLFFYLVFLCV